MRALLAALLLVATTASADEAEIRARLLDWAEAFNARDTSRVCDLYASDLVAVVAGAPDTDRTATCARLERVLAKPEPRLSYAPEISEILVWGDRAAARLTWTLSVDGTPSEVERGMDLFRRDPDGVWRIFRFVSFTETGAD